MSVSCELLVGYTVTLQTDLTNEDFEKYNDFIENNIQYDNNSQSGVQLIVDGMNGDYARLIYIDSRCDVEDIEDIDYKKLNTELSGEKYEALNKAYKALTGETLAISEIEYAVWTYWT